MCPCVEIPLSFVIRHPLSKIRDAEYLPVELLEEPLSARSLSSTLGARSGSIHGDVRPVPRVDSQPKIVPAKLAVSLHNKFINQKKQYMEFLRDKHKQHQESHLVRRCC